MDEYEVGDLVVTYLFNTSMSEPEIIQHGIIIEINETLKDILVVDNCGNQRWWNCKRWQILRKHKKTNKFNNL